GQRRRDACPAARHRPDAGEAHRRGAPAPAVRLRGRAAPGQGDRRQDPGQAAPARHGRRPVSGPHPSLLQEPLIAARFELVSKFQPAGDQPQAIAKILEGFSEGNNAQVLLGATGTGKTYTASCVIEKVGKPTLVLAHNKTLAAQLYKE